MLQVIKKDGTLEPFKKDKIINAIKKSANRVMYQFSEEEFNEVCNIIYKNIKIQNLEKVPINIMHNLVESALENIKPEVAKSYKDYRNYKQDFVHMLDDVYQKAQSIMYIGDKENSNTDSALVATKRSLIYNYLNKELYKKFFLNTEEKQACNEGYIYIHDMVARRDTINCCLFDMEKVLSGGFEMGNLWYNEPKGLPTAFNVIGDIILATASQQYGGFTVPEIDKILDKYAKKSFEKYKNDIAENILYFKDSITKEDEEFIEKKAIKNLEKDFEQGFQGLEYKLNSVGSSRGDYPFVTFSFGLGKTRFSKMASKIILRVHKNGQGKKGNKKPVLFPKIVFLYDENLHGEGKELEDIFEEAIECSKKTMYPDYLSLTGDSYVANAYKKYNTVISPMGCRAFLSLWFEKGGKEPLDETDKAISVGRFNIGAISLNLPMIYAKSLNENKPFFEILDYYLEMIRKLHLKTIAYLGEMKASTNPIAYCEGGFYGGNLKPNEKIKPILKSATASFGITALNELQRLYNRKSIFEDGEFALKTMEYINKKVDKFKQEDNVLYAIYGTPAESLCGLQIEQFRKKYGIIENVSDRSYLSNSFHCHVSEDITPIEKQDSEKRFWNLLNGGKIQYVKYPINYNDTAIKTLVRRAMELGFYEGINLSLSYCNECGQSELAMEICAKCGSANLTKIERMNGYLSYSRVQGDTRLNNAKMEEIEQRKSMWGSLIWGITTLPMTIC